jgi:hypothetical protein
MKLSILATRADMKPILGLVILCSAIIIVDSSIVAIYFNTSSEPAPIINTSFFISLVVLFAFINFILIRYSKQDFLQSRYKHHKIQRIFLWSIIPIEFILCLMLASIVVQLLVYRSYNVSILVSIIYISHITAIGFLTLLSYQFLSWLRSVRNYLVLWYTFAFSILLINILISLVYFTLLASNYDPIMKLRPIRIALIDTSFPFSLSTLAIVYDYLSIASFVFAWIPTVILLKTYAIRFGKAKYWLLVTIPIAYFILPFLFDELGTFDQVRLEYGRQFNLVYNIFFSPYRQVGALLFGLAFFMTATKIKRKDLRVLVLISGVGMTLLYASTVIHGLSYFVAPPFGLVTVSFVGLASYMLSIGIFASARELARDEVVRRDLSQIAGKQLSLLRNMGAAEMEKSLIKNIKPIMEKTIIANDTSLQDPMNQEDYKEMVREILTELKVHKKI